MRFFCLVFAFLGILLPVPRAICQSVPTQASQPSPTLGWLEGTILSNDGQIVSGQAYMKGNKNIHGVRHGGGEFDATTSDQLGGLYSAPNLRPGIYDITIEKGYIRSTVYAPQRIFGIVIKPGVRTLLNVVMNQGEQVEEIGSPVVGTDTAIPVSIQLTQLQQQVEALKQQLDALKKQVADLQAKTPPADAKLLK